MPDTEEDKAENEHSSINIQTNDSLSNSVDNCENISSSESEDADEGYVAQDKEDIPDVSQQNFTTTSNNGKYEDQSSLPLTYFGKNGFQCSSCEPNSDRPALKCNIIRSLHTATNLAENLGLYPRYEDL